MVSLSLQSPFSLASRLVEAGGVLILPGVPLIRHLVAEICWLGDSEAVILCVGEDLSLTPQAVRFKRLTAHGFGVCFEGDDGVVAALTPVEKAGLATPEDYFDLWRRWQQGPRPDGLSLDRLARSHPRPAAARAVFPASL